MKRASEAVGRCWPTHAAIPCLVWALSGCAAPSYVVLLPDHDGKVGKVQVTAQGHTTEIDEAGEAVLIGGFSTATFSADEQQIGRDFASALAASPLPPVTYRLYFRFGLAELVELSRSYLPTILAEIGRRPAPEILVIGHTDTAGDARRNEELALERASAVASVMRAAQERSPGVRIATGSHGERNPLVPTPDETYEPRNRRVEVTIR